MNLIISSLVIVVLLASIALAVEPAINDNLGYFMAGFTALILPIATVGLILLHGHTKNQKKQADQDAAQIFIAGVKLLESTDALVRTGGIYALYKIALINEKYRWQVAQILMSHIRSKTQEAEYQIENQYKPSNEIQMAIDLLFRWSVGDEDIGVLYVGHRGSLYGPEFRPSRIFLGFRRLLPEIDLSHAYLVGANFCGAHCENANFNYTRFEEADFRSAHCEKADFSFAHCEGAYFIYAYCGIAKFKNAHCEGANFNYACCHGADFSHARCHGVNFSYASCQLADFCYACCKGANFSHAGFQRAIFGSTNCHGAYADDSDRKTLATQIGEEEQLDVIVSGEYGTEGIKYLEKAKRHVGGYWGNQVDQEWSFSINQLKIRLRDGEKGKPIVRAKPEGMIVGVLEDSEELRALIKKLEEIDKRWREKRDW